MVNINISDLLDLLIGIDIGLLIYYLFIFLKIKKLQLKDMLDSIVLDNLFQDRELKVDFKEKYRNIMKGIDDGSYMPKQELLKMEFKYLTWFLVLYNLFILIFIVKTYFNLL
jgi:hypothetical protein